MIQGVILAGGKGTRLAKASGGVPKPLVPVAGVPIIERQIRLLARYGVREIFVTTGHRAEVLEEALGDGERYGTRLHHIREDEPLGTAGGVAALRDVLTEDFLVVYGDVLVHMDLQRLLDFHHRSNAAATIVVHPNDHPFDSDLVDCDEEGRVRGFHPKPREEGGPDLPNMVSAALYVLAPEALEHIEPGVPQDFVRDIFPRMHADGAALYAYHTTEYLKDMGTPERLARVSADVESGVVESMHADHLRPTLFLDRDGVINREIDGVLSPDDLELLPEVGAAIRKANKCGWLVGCVTNQPAIAKGFMSETDLERVHLRLQRVLGDQGAWLDGLAYCPHHPERGFEGERPELKVACKCRKPAVGLLARLADRLPVDRENAVMVGDSWRDMAAAHAFGAAAIGVLSGHGMAQDPPSDLARAGRPDVLVEDLAQAVALAVQTDPTVEALVSDLAGRAKARSSDAGPLLVAIGGLARAGKSSTAFRLRQGLHRAGVETLWLRLDDWILPAGERPPDSTLAQRYRWETLQRAVDTVALGRAVEAPGYDARTRSQPKAGPGTYRYDPQGADVVLLDGVPALLLDLPQAAYRVHAECASEEQRRGRLRRFGAFKGFSEGESDALIENRAAEHAEVTRAGNGADLRFVPAALDLEPVP